jgi:hypothetical protein
MAGIASAHTPQVALVCQQGNPKLTITLSYYTNHYYLNNTVSASIDGSSVLSTTNFKTSYSGSFNAGSSYLSHTAQVVIYAWDDPSGSHGWSKTINVSANACKNPTPSPTPTKTPTPTPTPTPPPPPRPPPRVRGSVLRF